MDDGLHDQAQKIANLYKKYERGESLDVDGITLPPQSEEFKAHILAEISVLKQDE